jgi:hypothetical protein
MDSRNSLIQSRHLQRALIAGLHLLLLAPVPALAYTLNNWQQVNQPLMNWTPVGSGLDLALSPAVGSATGGPVEFDFVAQVSGGANGVTVGTSNFGQLTVSAGSGTGGLTVTIGFNHDGSTTIDPSRFVFQSNQFMTGNPLPDSLPGTYSSSGVAVNNGDTAVVKFVFSDLSTWAPASVTSTAVHITFSPGN